MRRTCAPSQHSFGFALIATLSLIVLLALVAVSLLTLSSVNSSSTLAEDEAQTNAKLAVVQALSQLQNLSGADTRISANADLLDSGNPKVTGIWRSWEGSDHLASGQPRIPDYDQKLNPGDPK